MLSSAILYLAIVAIWACVLVPRWLRRSHVSPADPEVLSDQDQAYQAEYEPYDEFARLGEEDAAYADPVAWEDPAAPTVPQSSVEASYSVTASYSAEVTYRAETADAGVPADTAAYDEPADTTGYDQPVETAGHDQPVETDGSGVPVGHTTPGHPVGHRRPAAGHSHPQVSKRPPGPAPHVLQARRRTLTMLIAITIAAMGAALIGLVPWWTSVPPFVLLGMYLLLLREAAQADAEQARSWADAQAQAAREAREARAARATELARERAREAQAAPPPQQTAEIINISARVGDQLYDQYADAEIRAVGD
jgi:hypothetical protein